MEKKTISVTFEQAMWDIIINALVQRPYAEVAHVIAEFSRQASAQAAPQVNDAPAPAAE